MKFKAVIFDRDGVLVKIDKKAVGAFYQKMVAISYSEVLQMWENCGKLYGFPTTLEEEKIFFEKFGDYISDLHHLSDSDRKTLHDLDYIQFLKTYPETEAVLIELRDRGYKIGVLTNAALASLQAALEAMDLWQYIDVACSASVIGAFKPDPKAYQSILEKFNFQPGDCVFIDDEAPNVLGAESVGMTAYLLDRQLTDHDIAKKVLKDLNPLLQVL